MKYQTPQFIEEEEKLFGPLSFRQFVYLVGGLGLSFVIYKSIPLIFGIIIIIPLMSLSLALAFFKVNERPFIDTVEAAFYFVFSKRLYTYRKIDKPVKQEVQPQNTKITPTANPSVSGSKLKDLAWSLDINEKIIKDNEGA